MKKSLSILLSILLVLVQLPNSQTSAASSTDIIVTEVKTDKSLIRKNDDFTLSLTLENNSNKDLKSLAIGIDKSSSFRLSGTGSKQTFEFKDGPRATVDFKLIYNGGPDLELPITIYYEIDGTSTSFHDYVNINQARPEGPEKEPYDGSKDVPSISIVSSKTSLGESGDTITIPIQIKNNSSHGARDISTTIELDGDSPLYIHGDGHRQVSSLGPGKSRSLSFRVKVDPKAEDKTYPIKVNFQFYNDYDYAFTAGDTVYVKITDDKTPAQVVVNKVDLKPAMDILPGGNVMVGFEIQNKGDSLAKNLKISLKGLSNEGFSLASGLSTQSIPLLEPGKTRYIVFPLRSSRKIGSGNHDIDMILDYTDIKNKEFSDESKFFIPVASNKNQISNLIIQNIAYPTGSIGLNRDVDIGFSIRNQGQTKAENIIVTAESTDQSGLVPKSVSLIKLDSLGPGESKDIKYKFFTTGNAETKNYPINITVEYEDEFSSSGEKSSVGQFLGIFVLAPDDPDEDGPKSTPRLIIDKYTFQPKLVQAGENFEMNLSFFNTNSSKTVKNIKIFLTAEANTGSDPNSPGSGSSVFTPVDSSNTFYIDSIPPKGRVEKTITMFTIPDAMAKTHMITANFEYEDSQAEPYTATELIGVPVIQQSRLEIGELNYSPEAYLGDFNSISLEFYNTGKVMLYNMMVKLEGDFQTEDGSYYIGNFESGSSEFFEGTIIPSAPGLLQGAVVFTFEDSTGEEQEIRKDFTMNVVDMPPMDDFPDDMPPMDGGPGGIKGILKSKLLWATIILIASGFGGFKFYKKKKQEKEEKELALDE